MSKTILVSVGIPTYNRADGLRRTLECIVNQTYNNIEIIISDNGSSNPEIQKIGEEFSKKDNRVNYFRQENNKGGEFNFKFVLEKATGDYFMWAADDDEWNERFISECLKNIGNASAVMTGFITKYRKSNRLEYNRIPILNFKNSAYINALNFLDLMTPSLFYGVFKRADILFLLKEKMFDFYDCYFILKLILNKTFVTIQKPYYICGVEKDIYDPKPNLKRKGKFLKYRSFFIKTCLIIFKSKQLKFSERIKIFIKFLNRSSKLFIAYEKNHRFFHVILVKFFLAISNLKIFKKIYYNLFSFRNLDKSILIDNSIKKYKKVSFSQSGEDLIVKYVFDSLKIKNPTYIDIGAHHPFNLSNTALFHNLGYQGINIEPDPELFQSFLEFRPEDINLNIGISDEMRIADFYVINVPTLNTFDKKIAEDYCKEGNYYIKEIKKIELETVQNVIIKYNNGKFPEFLNIDVEGLDLNILKTINYDTSFPIVICCETISFSTSGRGVKNDDLINFLENRGYFIYADTNINSIFVRKDKWIRNN